MHIKSLSNTFLIKLAVCSGAKRSRYTFDRVFCITALIFLWASTASGQKKSAKGFSSIESAFKNAPDSIQTSIYWYWVDGNISKEGVVKDLEAMKKVGINRAFIGNVQLRDKPSGKVKMFTPEWWDILHTALKTATRLNIQIGIFNSPGWSQSGGPWIKPEQAMRYLTSSQITVEGPFNFDEKLARPAKTFQDVKVLAYPVENGYAGDITPLRPVLSSLPVTDSLQHLIDHNLSTAIALSANKQFIFNINTGAPYTLRSVTIHMTEQPARLEGDIQVKENGHYKTIKHFAIDRTNPNLNVGFDPYGPAAISVPETKSNNFRVVFTQVSSNTGISEVRLSATPVVDSYIEKSLAKMWPTPHPFWNAYKWQPQPAESSTFVVDPSKVIDISKYMRTDGTLKWNVPAGKWIIERTAMTPTRVMNAPAPPEGQGLEVDKMSKTHVAAHFNAFLGQILKRIPPADRKTFKITVEDSYETGGQNWTDELIPEFKEKYHYDPTPYMPVLQGKVVGSEDQSDRFLWDLRRLIADDVSFKYVGGLREISHKHGLTTWLENYGHWGFPGEFLQYGGQSDEIGGEFWSEGDLGDIENRAASSSAHIYGKTKVSAESFTAAGQPFYRYPAIFKKRGDRFFTEGINNTLLHVYIEQPQDTLLPGMTAPFGVEFNRLNTWFYDMDEFLQYIKRCNMMLQQGQYEADAAYFIGEDAPVMTGVTDPALPQGYSFDYINADVIEQNLTVVDGKLTLPNGTRYSVLVLPKLATMRPALLSRLKTLATEGAVILGPKPLRSPSLANYPHADRQVKIMADELWGNNNESTGSIHSYGKGKILSNMRMQQVFDLIGVVPDLKITNSDSILFIHRKLPQGDMYFVSNQKPSKVNFDGTFRITGKSPELWNAINGSIRDLTNYSDNGKTTTIPIQLAPYQSAFIIFRKDGGNKNRQVSNYPQTKNTIKINTPWTVYFDPKMRGPVAPVQFDTLSDWTQNSNDSIKYYAGTAWYHNTFNIDHIDPTAKYIIDLGLPRAIAKVTINGREAGGVWTPPYEVDITKAIKAGTNKLKIKVVNTWMNRLIGDSKLPRDQRQTSVLDGPDPKSKLEPSGLLQPVTIKEQHFN